MLNEQSNNVLIPEASFFLVKDAEFEKNDEEKCRVRTGNNKEKEMQRKRKDKKRERYGG